MNAVTWYDSNDTGQRRKCVRWQPSALDKTQGYILFARRDNPTDLWPTLSETPQGEPVDLYVARSFAVGFGCSWSDDDPGAAWPRKPGQPPYDQDDDPDPEDAPLFSCDACGATFDDGITAGHHSCRAGADDPDSYRTVNLNEPQLKLLRSLVADLLYFSPGNADLVQLAVQLRHHLKAVG